MHCFNLTVRYTVLPKSGALYPECVHYRLNWAEKGVYCGAQKKKWNLEPQKRQKSLLGPRLTSSNAHT